MKTLPQLVIQTLTPDLVAELVNALHHPLVYRYIDQPLPAQAEQVADLQHGLALAAQSEGASSQRWLHFLLRETAQQQIIGRLEATVYLNHSQPYCEIACLLVPAYWGRGYAQAALEFLHHHISLSHPQLEFWACTHAENLASQNLLTRAGYQRELAEYAPKLASYDAGDYCYRRRRDSNISA